MTRQAIENYRAAFNDERETSKALRRQLADAADMLRNLRDSIDRGDTILSWSPAYCARMGITDLASNIDSARAWLDKYTCPLCGQAEGHADTCEHQRNDPMYAEDGA
jgi:hypothetical protein